MIKNIQKKILVSALIATSLITQSYACTAISLIGNDNNVVAGRTMEWGFDWDWNIIYLPKGTLNKLTAPTKFDLPEFSYKSKYSVVGTGIRKGNESLLLDGQNSQGLGLSANYLPGFTTYQKVTVKDTNYGSILQMITYILSEYSNINEVEETLKTYTVWSDKSTEVNGVAPDVHLLITEKSGKALVVEYVNGEVKFYHLNKDVKVMTNAPTYDWHLINLRNYLNLTNKTSQNIKVYNNENQIISDQSTNSTISGLGQGNGFLGLPGDYSPPSRFIRAAVLGYYVNSTNLPGSTVSKVAHVLRNMDIPKGTVKEDIGNGVYNYDHTAFTVIKNLTDNTLYINSYENTLDSIRISLNDLDKDNSPILYQSIKKLPYPTGDITTTFSKSAQKVELPVKEENKDIKKDDFVKFF